MRLALVGEHDHYVFTSIKPHIDAEFIPIAELGLSTIGGKSGIDRDISAFKGYDAVFLQADPRLMLFVEPLLDELAEHGIFCQIKPTTFNILANKPYTYVSLSSRGIEVPKMRSVASGSGIEAAVEGLSFPIIIEAFRDLDRTQTMILTDKLSLYPFLRSIPFEYNLIMIQELLEGSLIESLVIGEEVYSMRRAWNAERLEHQSKAQSTKMSSEDKNIAIAATKALGIEIARVKMIGSAVIGVDPRVETERFEHVLSIDIGRRIANHFMEKNA